MAVTTREQQMLDLAADRLTHQEIAARMGISTGSVRRTLAWLSDSPAPDRLREAEIRKGTEKLVRAIVAAGGFPGAQGSHA